MKADIFIAYRALLSMTQAHTQSVQPSSVGGDADAMEVSDRYVDKLVYISRRLCNCSGMLFLPGLI